MAKYTQIYITKNEPDLSKNFLANKIGVQRLGIQGLPGMGFRLGPEGSPEIMLGQVGLLDLDISNYSMTIEDLYLTQRAVNLLQGDAFILIDVVYEEEGDK